MGCKVSTTADPVVVNELKKSRHSRRRMSMDSKFIEERHTASDNQPSTSNMAGDGISGRTTATALSYETVSAGSGGVKYGQFRSRHRTWSLANRVNSEPTTEYRNSSPASVPDSTKKGPIAGDDPIGARSRDPLSYHGRGAIGRQRLASVSSQAESFVLVQRRVVVAWEAPPSLSPIRQHQEKPRRHGRLSRASSCSWPSPSAVPSGPTSTYGSQTLPYHRYHQEQQSMAAGANQAPPAESMRTEFGNTSVKDPTISSGPHTNGLSIPFSAVSRDASQLFRAVSKQKLAYLWDVSVGECLLDHSHTLNISQPTVGQILKRVISIDPAPAVTEFEEADGSNFGLLRKGELLDPIELTWSFSSHPFTIQGYVFVQIRIESLLFWFFHWTVCVFVLRLSLKRR